jgi:hypothetical protein
VFSCIAVSGVGAGNDPAEQEQQTIQSIVANTLPQNFISTIAQLPEALQVRVAFAYPPQSLAQAIELAQAEFGSLPESTQLVIAGLVKAEATQVGSCIGLFSCIAVTGAGQAPKQPATPPSPQVGNCIGLFSCIAVSGVGTGTIPAVAPWTAFQTWVTQWFNQGNYGQGRPTIRRIAVAAGADISVDYDIEFRWANAFAYGGQRYDVLAHLHVRGGIAQPGGGIWAERLTGTGLNWNTITHWNLFQAWMANYIE